MLRAYLINLDGSQERLAVSSQQLEQANIPFTRVSAVDGRKNHPRTNPAYNEKRAMAYLGRNVSGGEFGCYLSHLKAAQMFLESNAKYGMVLEDDMSIESDLSDVVTGILEWLEEDGRSWDLINIGTDGIKRHTPLHDFDSMSGTHSLTRAHYFPMTTGGLIWSRVGAEKFVNSQNLIYAPVDNYLRAWLTKTNTGLAVWPSLVKARGVQSDIDVVPSASRETSERHFFYNLIRHRWYVLNKFRSIRHLWAAKLHGKFAKPE